MRSIFSCSGVAAVSITSLFYHRMRAVAAIVALFFAMPALAQECEEVTRTMAGNFAVNLGGEEIPPVVHDQGKGDEQSPGLWGTGAYWLFPLTFNVPIGCRVRVLEIDAAVDARMTWPNSVLRDMLPTENPKGCVGVLGAVMVHGEDDARRGSRFADFADDATLAYKQDNLCDGGRIVIPLYRSFGDNVANTVLPEDKLYFKVASWLNETAMAVHAEMTFNLLYKFEPISEVTR